MSCIRKSAGLFISSVQADASINALLCSPERRVFIRAIALLNQIEISV